MWQLSVYFVDSLLFYFLHTKGAFYTPRDRAIFIARSNLTSLITGFTSWFIGVIANTFNAMLIDLPAFF